MGLTFLFGALGLGKTLLGGGRDLFAWFRYDELGKRLGIAFLAVIAVIATVAWSYGKGSSDATIKAELKAASAKVERLEATLAIERAHLASSRLIETEQRLLAETGAQAAALAEAKLEEALRVAASSPTRGRVCIPADLNRRLRSGKAQT